MIAVGLIIEPLVQGAAGMWIHPAEYLRALHGLGFGGEWAAGAVLMGALGAVAGYYARDTTGTIAGQAAKTGGQLGGAVGRISFSKEQEREADYLAAVILYRSGLDLDKARGFMVTIARASTRKETGMLDTHPAGPERLAGWDKAVAEVRASNGSLPQRA